MECGGPRRVEGGQWEKGKRGERGLERFEESISEATLHQEAPLLEDVGPSGGMLDSDKMSGLLFAFSCYVTFFPFI